MKLIKIFLLMSGILFFGCNITYNQMVGKYVGQNLVNNIDTIELYSNGEYSKKLYRKKDNSIIYHNTGQWTYKDGRIVLKNFFLDNDQKYNREFKRFNDVLITSSLIVSKKFNKITIEYGQGNKNLFYEKL